MKKRKPYTIKEHNFLLVNYPLHGKAYCAKQLGRSPSSINNYVSRHKIRYTGDNNGRYNSNNVPWNKGLKQPIPGSEKTWFKKGNTPKNARKVGEIYIRNEKGTQYKYIKYAEDKRPMPLHRYLWEQAHGKIPKYSLVVFKDGDTLNCTLENLECITRAENVLRINAAISPENKKKRARKAWETRDRRMRKRLGLPV